MARLTIPLNHPSDAKQVDLALDILHYRFLGGWVFYDILPTFDGQPILNGVILKAHENVRAGALSACEDEVCTLLPAMRRLIETGKAETWEPTDPDVTITMKLDDARSGLSRSPGDRDVLIMLAADAYQWRRTMAYDGALMSIAFTCGFAAFRRFYEELRGEYLVFAAANDIRGYNLARGFHCPDHDWF